jgi:hypothetical protein
MSHRQYRSLEQECRIQAAITTDQKTREELAKMEREYRVIAQWLELRQQTLPDE